MKNNEAYRRYTILVSIHSRLVSRLAIDAFVNSTATPNLGMVRRKPTLILKKIAHASSAREDKLGHVFDDLGFVLGRQRGKPFRKALEWRAWSAIRLRHC